MAAVNSIVPNGLGAVKTDQTPDDIAGVARSNP